MFRNVRLSVKLTAGFAVVLGLLVGVAAIFEYATTTASSRFSGVIEKSVATANHAKEAEVLMLQCRRSEKDFLLRKDMQYATAMNETIAKLKTEAEAIITLSKGSGDNGFAKAASEISTYAAAYQKDFEEIVKAWEARGLDENSGLQGKFRTVARDIMDRVKAYEVGDLYIALLQMRRFEKDYARTPTDDYKKKLTTAVTVCRQLAENGAFDAEAKQAVAKAMTVYAGAFDKYVAAGGNSDLQTQCYELMRSAAHEVESAVDGVYVPDAGKLALAIRRDEKDYLLRGDEKYATATHKAVSDLVKAFESSGVLAKHISAMKADADAYLAAFDGLVSVDKTIATTTTTLRDTVHKIEPLVEKIAADAMTQTKSETESSLSQAKSLGYLALCIAIGTLIVGTAVCVLITRSIIKPLKRIIAGIREGSEQVASASGQVSSASQSLAEGATEQAAGLEETSSSLEEMSSMTKQNADNAQQANTLAAEAKKAAGTGAESMSRMNTAIQEIQKSSSETAKIIKVIDEIAFQTNLLALNAAVEAARAGEAGKGFAVVAEEVRNLAMRSAEAAKNTASMIEESVKNSKNGVDIATEVGKVLEEIVQSVGKTTDLVSEIAAASQEQAQGIDQVNTAVAQMDKVTQQNAANAEESASASEELSSQAESMNEIVGELVTLVGGSAARSAGSGKKERHSLKAADHFNAAHPAEHSVAKEHAFGRSDEVLHKIAHGDGKAGRKTPGKPTAHKAIPLDPHEDELKDFNK